MIERRAEAPHTNRGVENTSKYPLIVDWVTFSGHFQTFQEMIEFLGLKNSGLEFKECSPRWFYKYSVTYDNHITLMLTQKEDYTAACVNISGQGCRLIESFSCYSLLDLIKRVALLDDFNMSRIDIAQDIIDDKFNIDKLVKAYKKGNYTCRSKFSNLMQSIDDGIEGTSLYFGKKGSNCFINIYDKRAERGFIPEDMPNWTRIEIRLRAENAKGFADKLLTGQDVGFFIQECLITTYDLLLLQMILINHAYQRHRIGRKYYSTRKKYRCLSRQELSITTQSLKITCLILAVRPL